MSTTRYEFGGPLGAAGIVLGLPVFLNLLFFGCNDINGCPDFTFQLNRIGVRDLITWDAIAWLGAYYFVSLVLHRVLPAQEVYGTKLRESGKPLKYRFNAFSSTMIQFAACAVGTYIYGAEFPVWRFIADNCVQLLNASHLLSYAIALYVYLGSFSVKKGNPELRELAKGGQTGSAIYDFYIGRELNPRVMLPFFGEIDIKAFIEMRPGLTGWALLNCSFIAKQYRLHGEISNSMMLVAGLQMYYVLEGQYFESGILGMMDMVTDGLGFMLVFGSLVWVPFLYCTQTRYLSVHPVHLSWPSIAGIATVFSIGLYIFRSANNQKSLFRKDPNHPAVKNLPFIQTKRGTRLLAGGWWGSSRHINYFGDWLQSLPFCLPTGVAGYRILEAGGLVLDSVGSKTLLDGRIVTPDGAAPWGMLFTYVYSVYFGTLLIHREGRDDHACAEKYGSDWVEYKRRVPWRIIPGVY